MLLLIKTSYKTNNVAHNIGKLYSKFLLKQENALFVIKLPYIAASFCKYNTE